MDPWLLDTTNIVENAEILAEKISELDIPFDYEIYYTSIYNFNNKNYITILENHKLNTLRPLIDGLFSTF
jgi:hypothetical protein